jgi:hypothetical protein
VAVGTGASCHGNLIPISGLTRFSDVSAIYFYFILLEALTRKKQSKEIKKVHYSLFTVHCLLHVLTA